MKTETRVLNVDSTLEGERVGMSIDESALAHIMSVLTDLYSDPEMAVIREYSTNAFDAHIEAGVKRPIEIILPSHLSPFFRVRDYGFGLDIDDIRDIYSRYGTSTKRESNDVVGMLGLGCKSALTYTDQFTLTSVKNGICTQVSVSRDEDGGGSMTIVDEYETDAPSGTEIIVPTHTRNEFEYKSNEFFRFWTPGTVLVNGEEPKRVDGLWIADDICLTSEVTTNYVIMGNVPYPVESSYARNYYVAFVDIGDVQFTPSREALQMTLKTKRTLEAIRVRIVKEKVPAFQRIVDEQPNRIAALKKNIQIYRLFNEWVPTYKGEDIPVELKNVDKDNPWINVQHRKYYRNKGWNIENSVSLTWMSDRILWITGYDANNFTPHKRKKLMLWLAGLEIPEPEHYLFVKELPNSNWINPDNVYPWADIEAQKIERPARDVKRNGRPYGSYDGLINDKYIKGIKAEDINTSKPLFYTNTSVHGRYSYSGVINLHYPKGWTVIHLTSNRINKFKRDFPNAIELYSYITKATKDWTDKLTKNQQLQIYIRDHHEVYSNLDYTKIDDPVLRKTVKYATMPSKLIDEYKIYYPNGRKFQNEFGDWINPKDKYPLLKHVHLWQLSSDEINDLYIYFNAVYAARKDK